MLTGILFDHRLGSVAAIACSAATFGALERLAHMSNPKPALSAAAAVIFDVDGTLVDSVDFHAEAWRRAFAAFRIDVAFDEIRSQIGKGGDQLLPVFLDSDELAKHGEQIEAFRSDLFKRDYLAKVRGFPGTRELFERLIADGKIIALGSSAKGEELQAYKKAVGIDELKLIEVSSDDADRSKPHPDIFEAALERIGVPSDQTIVVGDTPYDVEAANKAGIRAIAVLCGGFDEGTLRGAGAIEIYAGPEAILKALDRASKD